MAGWPDKGKGMFAIEGPVYGSKSTPRGMQSRFE
jgi:hypothetical protein